MEDPESKKKSCHRSAALVAALALVPGLVGCPPRQAREAAAGKKLHLQQVQVDANANADPDPVKVKKKLEIVVWESPAGSQLEIQFTQNPFPRPVVCPGNNFCASLLPPEGVEQSYKYSVTVTTGGSSKTSDPKLEVVP
jgi:hypothetical protein